MDGLKNYREKIKSIEELVNKMESGELSINELLELEKLTRDLHERSIILKYKAFENKSEVSVEEVEASIQALEIEEVVEEVKEVREQEIDLFEEKDDTPVMDFSMFDTTEVEEKAEEPKAEESKPVEEEKSEENAQVSSEPSIAKEPVKEEPIVEQIQSEFEKSASTPEPIADESKAVIKEKGTSFLDRLNIVDNSISSQLAGRKIETLSGAFGINERLLYINELFDGSGEAFSDAVKMLDSQPNLDVASSKIEELAFQNSWNPEEDTVLEFLAIIKRRYA